MGKTKTLELLCSEHHHARPNALDPGAHSAPAQLHADDCWSFVRQRTGRAAVHGDVCLGHWCSIPLFAVRFYLMCRRRLVVQQFGERVAVQPDRGGAAQRRQQHARGPIHDLAPLQASAQWVITCTGWRQKGLGCLMFRVQGSFSRRLRGFRVTQVAKSPCDQAAQRALPGEACRQLALIEGWRAPGGFPNGGRSRRE